MSAMVPKTTRWPPATLEAVERARLPGEGLDDALRRLVLAGLGMEPPEPQACVALDEVDLDSLKAAVARREGS